MEENELLLCKKYFPVFKNRSAVPSNSLVIPRYSALPFYKELEEDVTILGSKLLNSYREHRYVADLKNYYEDLKHFTPQTWFKMEHVPDNEGPFVLKGETNSRKDKFSTHMFARDKQEAIQVMMRLMDDSLIGQQEIYIRKFMEFESFGTGMAELPIINEYRVFVLDGKILSKGFYWSSHMDIATDIVNSDSIPVEFLNSVIDIVKNNIRFFVIDVARLKNGNWMVIELNDGQQAGLSENNPDDLYFNMSKTLL